MRRTAKPRRKGQHHPRAVLTDREVELMRQLHEDPVQPWGYKRLSAKFEVPKRTVRRICKYRNR